ncbi:hypothetical protein A2U01_0092064, partial [Trifolium medium]|nr:hypothetical protein [Trifolium medium]
MVRREVDWDEACRFEEKSLVSGVRLLWRLGEEG